MVDALNRLFHNTEPVGIPNQISNANMFTLEPKWFLSVYQQLSEIVMLEKLIISQRQYLAQRAKPNMHYLLSFMKKIYTSLGKTISLGESYNQNRCLPYYKSCILELLEGIFLQLLLCAKYIDASYWWPTMNRDVHEFC